MPSSTSDTILYDKIVIVSVKFPVFPMQLISGLQNSCNYSNDLLNFKVRNAWKIFSWPNNLNNLFKVNLNSRKINLHIELIS